MKRLVLHIGRHKTGTTNLQFALADGAEALKRAGACYPVTGRDAPYERDRTAHHELALALMEGNAPKLEALHRAFRAEVARFDPVIVSSEAFQNLCDLRGLRQFFEGFHIEVVCYMREYLAYCASAYAQDIQTTPMAADFATFMRLCAVGYRPREFRAMWSDVADSVVWRLYDRSALVDGDIVADFERLIGFPLPSVESDVNRSISGNLIAFKVLVNALGLHQWQHSHVLGELAAAHRRFSGRFYISPEDQAAYRASNPCNAMLQEMFGDIPLADFSRGNPILGPGYLEDFDLIREALGEPIASHPLLRYTQG